MESSEGFFGLRSGTMIEDFHIAGMVLVLRDMLNMSVRYWCLRWRVEIWSGPSALEALAFLIAS